MSTEVLPVTILHPEPEHLLDLGPRLWQPFSPQFAQLLISSLLPLISLSGPGGPRWRSWFLEEIQMELIVFKYFFDNFIILLILLFFLTASSSSVVSALIQSQRLSDGLNPAVQSVSPSVDK